MAEDEGSDVYGTIVEGAKGAAGVAAKGAGVVVGASKFLPLPLAKTGAWGYLAILIGIIIGVYALWYIGSTVVGFFFTQLGMLCIGLFVVAVIVFLYLRSTKIIEIKGTAGAIALVLIIMAGLFIFIGLLDTLSSMFFMAMPFIVLGGGAFIGYKLVQRIKDENMKKFAVVAVVAVVVALPIFEMFIIPKSAGTPLEIKALIRRGEADRITIDATLMPYQAVQTMTTSLNPYYIVAFESSHLMWVEVGTTKKIYVDITVSKHTGDEGVLYQERGKVVYIAADEQVGIWGMVRIPFEPHYAEYKLDVKATDAGGIILAENTFIYTTGG